MMNRIKTFFKTNMWLKLISVGIAFAIWLMVVNISNPEVKTTLNTDIEINYEESLTSLDKYYSLDVDSAKVNFNVRTNERKLVSASDFHVYVDMRDYSITGALPVYVETSDRIRDLVSDIKVTPVVVHATTEDMQEKIFDLTADTIGHPADGYAVGEIEFSPNRVTLYGPNSEVGKISRIGFNVNVERATDKIWGTAEFVYYDANDNVISPDVRIVVKNSVSYIAPIYKKKNVSVTVQAFGEQAEGYSLDSVSCEPSFIEVYGDDEVLNSINAIILPSGVLNITGATRDVTASIDIEHYLPEGVYTDQVGNIALIARITRSHIVAPTMMSPEGDVYVEEGAENSGEDSAAVNEPAEDKTSEDDTDDSGHDKAEEKENKDS